jgi:hypothetical protein
MAVSNFENGLGEVLWSRRRDSNPRPALYESAALPLSYVGTRARLAHRRSISIGFLAIRHASGRFEVGRCVDDGAFANR